MINSLERFWCFPTENLTRRARLLVMLLLLSFTATLTSLPFLLRSALPESLVILAVLAVCTWLLHRKRLLAASWLFVGILWGVIFIFNLDANLDLNRLFVGHIITIIIAGVLLPHWGAALVAALSLGYSLWNTGTEDGLLLLTRTLGYIAGAVIVITMERQTRAALQRLQERENHLAMSNTLGQLTINNLQEAKQALSESEQRYRQLLDNAPVAIIVNGMNNEGLLYINEAGLKLTGAQRIEDFAGQRFRDYMTPESFEQLLASIDQIKHQPFIQHQYRLRRFDDRWIDIESHAIQIEFQGVPAMMSIVQDVTERNQAEALLREREEMYRTIFEASPVAIVIASMPEEIVEGEILYANPAGVQLFHADSAEALIGSKAREPYDAKAISEAEQNIRALQQNHNLVVEYPFRRRNGEIRYVELNVSLMTHKGQPASLSVLVDVTERYRAREALQRSETLFRQVFEYAGLGIVIGDMDGKLIRANHQFLRIVGYSEDEIRGVHFQQYTHPDDTTQELQFMQELNAGERDYYEIEKRYIHKEGHVVWVHLIVTVIDGYEEDAHALVFVDDITRRKQAEAALRESEQRYQQLLHTSPVALIVTDLDEQRVLFANRAAANLLGAESPEAVVGLDIAQTVAPDHEGVVNKRVERLKQGVTLDAPIIKNLRRLDGEVIQVQVGATPITYAGRRAALSALTDVTAQRRAEEEQRKRERLQMEMEKQQQITQLRESFMAMILHEFRTPLTVIRSSKDIIARYHERLDGQRRQSHFDKIDQSINYMVRMLDNILSLSKAGAGMLDFNPVTLDLESTLQDLLHEFQQETHNAHAVDLRTEGNWQGYRFDDDLIFLMVTNLLSYVIRSDPERIHVTLRQQDDQAIIVINNPFEFISADERENLFEPFFYRSREAQNLQGNKLGLAVAQAAAEQHQGSVRVQSDPEQGTTFTLQLPLTPT